MCVSTCWRIWACLQHHDSNLKWLPPHSADPLTEFRFRDCGFVVSGSGFQAFPAPERWDFNISGSGASKSSIFNRNRSFLIPKGGWGSRIWACLQHRDSNFFQNSTVHVIFTSTADLLLIRIIYWSGEVTNAPEGPKDAYLRVGGGFAAANSMI